MSDHNIILPSKPRIVLEEENKGVYEIDNLYRGYGHTLGNSLRRIILSSLPGVAITHIKIEGVAHEFSVIEGVKEDVIQIILNLKKVRFDMVGDGPETVTLSVKGQKVVTAKDIQVGGQITVANGDQYILELSDKTSSINIELTLEKGLGFVPKEIQKKGKMDIGTIALDAIFTPIRRVSYEVENMRVGDKTDYNRLRISVETDGTVTPRYAVERSVQIMLEQLHSIVEFEPTRVFEQKDSVVEEKAESSSMSDEDYTDVMKTRIDSLDFSTRTENALTGANIRTLGGLAKKKKDDLLTIDGLGEKGMKEIEKVLNSFGLNLK